MRWWVIGSSIALIVLASVGLYPIWRELQLSNTSDQHQRASINALLVPHIPVNDRNVLMIMIDGLAVKPFEHLLANHQLPNLERLFSSRATARMNAISTFPSATSPSVQELLSGRYAEIDNLSAPGAVHAFDRQGRRIIRYVTEPDAWQWPVPTLFDATRNRTAVTVFEGRWDGPTAIMTQYNLIGQALMEALGAPEISRGDRGPVEAFLKKLHGPSPPSVSLVVLSEFDVASHFHGPESDQAYQALRVADKLIGDIVSALQSGRAPDGASMLDHTTILLFGDHGMDVSGRFVDLPRFLEQRKLRAVDVATVPHVIFRERLGPLWTEWPDAILVAGGSNITQIYLRREGGGWSDAELTAEPATAPSLRPVDPAELAAQIATLEGVGQVLWKVSGRGVQVLAGNGTRARVEFRTVAGVREFAYVVPHDADSDPFGYLGHAATRTLVCRHEQPESDCFHSATQWFDQSYATRYPGAVPLLPKAFIPDRYTGDLMVTLQPGYTFLRNQNGDHGNLERDAILTPLILNGPGVHPCEPTHRARLVDIFPTVSVILGTDPEDPALRGMDGRILECANPPPAGNDGA